MFKERMQPYFWTLVLQNLVLQSDLDISCIDGKENQCWKGEIKKWLY